MTSPSPAWRQQRVDGAAPPRHGVSQPWPSLSAAALGWSRGCRHLFPARGRPAWGGGAGASSPPPARLHLRQALPPPPAGSLAPSRGGLGGVCPAPLQRGVSEPHGGPTAAPWAQPRAALPMWRSAGEGCGALGPCLGGGTHVQGRLLPSCWRLCCPGAPRGSVPVSTRGVKPLPGPQAAGGQPALTLLVCRGRHQLPPRGLWGPIRAARRGGRPWQVCGGSSGAVAQHGAWHGGGSVLPGALPALHRAWDRARPAAC